MTQERNGNPNSREWDAEEKAEIVEEANKLLDLGIPFSELPNYPGFEGITTQTLNRWGVKADRSNRLTPLDRIFCNEYMKTLSIPATTRALAKNKKLVEQYPQVADIKNFGYNTFSKESVQKKIKEMMHAAEIDAEYVLLGIKKNIERCEQAVPVFDREGLPVRVVVGTDLAGEDVEIAAAYTYDSMAVLKGYEMLGKNLKIFSDKIQHSNDPENPMPSNNTVVTQLPPDAVEAAKIYSEIMKYDKKKTE